MQIDKKNAQSFKRKQAKKQRITNNLPVWCTNELNAREKDKTSRDAFYSGIPGNNGECWGQKGVWPCPPSVCVARFLSGGELQNGRDVFGANLEEARVRGGETKEENLPHPLLLRGF
jgi:hypothetical protein